MEEDLPNISDFVRDKLKEAMTGGKTETKQATSSSTITATQPSMRET